MATTLSTRLPAAEQARLSVLLPRLSNHLESVSPEAVEQEIRHALKRLTTDVNLDEAVLAVFEIEAGAPRHTKIVTTGNAIEGAVADLVRDPWMLEKDGRAGAGSRYKRPGRARRHR